MQKISAYIAVLAFFFLNSSIVRATPTIPATISDNRATYSNSQIPKYKKIEIKFQIQNTAATNFFLPFSTTDFSSTEDPNKYKGITVNAVFTDPAGTNYTIPAFYTKEYQTDSSGNLLTKDGKVWAYPTGVNIWKVRFSPNKVGTWQYKLTAQDSSGFVQSSINTFTVADSTNKGFIKVSPTDSRYFEFDNGEPFLGIGYRYDGSSFATLKANGVNFVRDWWSGTYGTSWSDWTGGNSYLPGGYLPKTMLYPITDPANSTKQIMTTRIDTDGGWFDKCIQSTNTSQAVKNNTYYIISTTFVANRITGPLTAGKPYGVIAKIENGGNGCENISNSPTSSYGSNTPTLSTISTTWNSGSNNFLPRTNVALENVKTGEAEIVSISVKEDLGNGNLGPEILEQPSSDFHLYVSDQRAMDADRELSDAEANDVYMKIVLLEKEDKMWKKINTADGSLTVGVSDNNAGFYGNGRVENKHRFLEKAWFRYAQARWGYSPNIHSWELLNEGDPGNTNHYILADELGKYMHCTAFGVNVGSGNSTKCVNTNPNLHMVTTSFWTSFPATNFWMNTLYPNVDYADVHAYISTSDVTNDSKTTMEQDSAFYHLSHSSDLSGWKIGKPIVRGEAGMDSATSQNENILNIQCDIPGTWVKTYLWSTLDSGALYELYWWDSHLVNNGVNSNCTNPYDHRSMYKNFNAFLTGLKLNNGKYVDLAATSTNSNLEIIGQKDLTNKNAHFWVRNKNYTWKNMVNNLALTPQTASVTIPGFENSKSYSLETWNTDLGTKTSSSITSSNTGIVTISISNLTKDTAYKIINTAVLPTVSATPTSTPVVSINPDFDVNKDGKVDLADVLAVIGAIFK